MRYLLDTHVMLWWLRDDPKLGSHTRMAIADSRSRLMVSVASFWELSIKRRNGKFDEDGSELFDQVIDEGIEVLGVQPHHLRALELLEKRPDHNDPFDHLIMAQAIAENAVLITGDKQIRQYDVRCFPDIR